MLQVDDEYLLLASVQPLLDPLKPPPIFMCGHSLGGLIACHTVLRSPATWAGLILLSAAIDVEWTWAMRYGAYCRPGKAVHPGGQGCRGPYCGTYCCPYCGMYCYHIRILCALAAGHLCTCNKQGKAG